MRRTAIILTLAVGALATVWTALVAVDALARDGVRTSQPLTLPADGALRLSTGSGDVTVTASTGPARLVAESSRGLFGGSAPRITRSADGRISVDADCDFPRSIVSCGGSLEVLLPAGTALELDTGSGEVAVRGVRGGVVAETGSGDVDVTDVGGPEVRIGTGSGEITVAGITAGRLRAETGSGDVAIAASAAPDDIWLETGSGEVDLVVPDEVYDVGTETGSGDQRVTVRSDSTAPRRLRVNTGSGDITVRPAR